MDQLELVSDVVESKAPPTIFIELVDQGSSGFIQNDTIGTPTQIEVRAPGRRYIPNTGYRLGEKKEGENGKQKTVKFNEKIRYIKNETVISVTEQQKLGIEPNPLPTEDKIFIEKGFAMVVREGSTIGLYDYLSQSFYNESNPNRSPKATALYRVLQIDKEAEKFNEDELVAADAVKYVGTLYQRTSKNNYQYNEVKIDAVCEMFAVFAESYATKIKSLLLMAKQRPEWFLDRVTKLEQTTITEVVHALELNVIQFKENTAQYCNKEKVLYVFDGKRLNREGMISKLADFLRTREGHQQYMELKAELEVAQTGLLNQ